MRIALLQFSPTWGDEEENIIRIGALVRHAKDEGAQIAALPEMSTTGFFPKPPPSGAASDRAFSAIAAECGIAIVAGYAGAAADGALGRNLAAAYDRTGKRVSLYSKMHPFSPLGEHRHYEAGTAPSVFELDGLRSSAFICYDLRFPESVRPVAGSVDALFFLANWPASRAAHWAALLRARAIENQCYVLGVNRTGTDRGGIAYAGDSCAFGPSGELIAHGVDEVVYAEVDPLEVTRVRLEFPFLADMRPG